MMATAAVIGLSAGKRLLTSSSYYCPSDVGDKFQLYGGNDRGGLNINSNSSNNVNVAVAKRASNSNPDSISFPSSSKSSRLPQPIKALKERQRVPTLFSPTSAIELEPTAHDLEEQTSDLEYSLEALLLLQKSMLETQWNLCFERHVPRDHCNKKKIPVTCSGLSARQRRMATRTRVLGSQYPTRPTISKQLRTAISPELLQNRLKGYVKGVVSDDLLTHAEVVHLSNKIKAGLSLADHKSRLGEKLGCEPSDEQLATSLRISRAELQSKLIECSLAREKLAMSNVRLVMSIAQRYDHMGAEMADLVQGGLIGLLRGIEKFDSSKGFKISTYVYWWIRQGVSRALVENSRTLRLPAHLHERLGLIRNAKLRLEEKGVTPSVDRIAESLNMSEKKVRNATEVIGKVYSLDRDAFPSLNGLPGETHHSYIADNRLENNPWHGVDELALKDEVNKLIDMTLGKREREIIRLYYGLDKECLTWEDISKRIGLSRERVRQVGLVALEKLKHVARKRKMEAMLLKQ